MNNFIILRILLKKGFVDILENEDMSSGFVYTFFGLQYLLDDNLCWYEFPLK